MSKLDEFLQDLVAEHESDGSGKFMLAPDKALQKIASYQRPFPEVWLVKVVQAAVASESESIQIKLTRDETIITFQGGEWGAEAFAESFHKPESTGEKALDHLLLGLWYVALGQDHPFRISFARADTELHWDGDVFHRNPCERMGETCLSVPHLRVSQVANWMTRRRLSSSKCAELAMCLTKRAYVCPVPIFLDGRRLDSLRNIPSEGELPLHLDSGFITDGTPRWQPPSESQLVFISWDLWGHIYWKPSVIYEKGQWDVKPSPCELIWVQDGVVLMSTLLESYSQHGVSLKIHLSAEGLKTDLSGFRLVKDSTLMERRKAAIKRVVGALPEPNIETAVADLKKDASATNRIKTFLVGVITLPAYGLGSYFIYSALTKADQTKARQKITKELRTQYRFLREDIGETL